MLIHLLLAICLGCILPLAGLFVGNWQFWAIIVVVILIQINAMLSVRK